ncbi:MAG TPA: hypothetical protein VFE62_06215 [Gemmataceae bacterium]|nr:hypothetical protein [Gemmataceae bacterium]
MARAICTISVVLTFLTATMAHAQEGRLQRVRDEASSSGSSSNNGNNANSSNDRCSSSSSDDDCGSNNGLGVLLLPFYLPAGLLGDTYTRKMPFTPHPYADGYRGYQILTPEWAKTYYEFDTAEVTRKDWALRVSVENGNDFDGLNRLGGQVKLEHVSRFGIFTNWNYFHENLPNGRSDETVIGDTNLTFRFAENEVASMYAGLGFRYLTDRQQTDFGFNFTYGGDWFPVRPLVLSGQFDAGWLGSAGVIHARTSVGVIWQGIEVYAGYDFLRIGDVNLQGPMAGVRFWF